MRKISRCTVPIIWDSCRRKNGTIDLQLAARHTGCRFTEKADAYLRCIEEVMPINSRQTAALAIVTALHISASFGGK